MTEATSLRQELVVVRMQSAPSAVQERRLGPAVSCHYQWGIQDFVRGPKSLPFSNQIKSNKKNQKFHL